VIASKENTSSTTILQETVLNPEEEENTVVPCSFVQQGSMIKLAFFYIPLPIADSSSAQK